VFQDEAARSITSEECLELVSVDGIQKHGQGGCIVGVRLKSDTGPVHERIPDRLRPQGIANMYQVEGVVKAQV
jgi:hypothetical protein